MKKTSLSETAVFEDSGIKKFLVHDSPWFKIINFNIKAGKTFPIHSHNLEGQLSMLILEGTGEFLGKDSAMPANPGDILISDISEPHGARAITDLRILVTIAPPI
ncbi:MAG: cupin [Proteobacteria bacterium]|nr:cupin [Pseudomonadota bacterium]MBU1708636.1 cupin [Pseudomonadota bacterium]